jgi:hypothetical protein
MSLINVATDDSRSGPPSARENRPGLACERCKRRKIKCDRALPACRTCVKMTRSCIYPSVSQKPGPKPGAPQRRKPRRLNFSSPPSLSRSDFNDASNPGAGDGENTPTTISEQFQHGLKRLNQKGPAEEASQTQHSRSTPLHLEAQNRLLNDPEKSPSRGLTLSQLLHPSHEPMQQDSADVNDEDMHDGQDSNIKIGHVCKTLGITMQTYHRL